MSALVRSVKASRSSWVHQSLTFPVPSKVEPWSSEAVADLVTDDSTDPRVVHSVVGLRVEEGRLKDRLRGRQISFMVGL